MLRAGVQNCETGGVEASWVPIVEVRTVRINGYGQKISLGRHSQRCSTADRIYEILGGVGAIKYTSPGKRNRIPHTHQEAAQCLFSRLPSWG